MNIKASVMCRITKNSFGKYVVHLSTLVYLFTPFLFSGKCQWSKPAVVMESVPLSSKPFWCLTPSESKFGTSVRSLCKQPHARLESHVDLFHTVGSTTKGVVIRTLVVIFCFIDSRTSP
jgi:hypothetical protein